MRISNQAVDSLKCDGWIIVQSDVNESLLGFAEQLGKPVPSHSRGGLVDILRPQNAEDAPKNSLSSRYGAEAFPFHTDAAHKRTPPRYVFLRAISNSTSIRPTLLLDFQSINLAPEDLLTLERDVWIVNSGRASFPTTLISHSSKPDQKVLRYDTACMQPAHEGFKKSENIMSRILEQAKSIEISWTQGLIVIFDNWRVLHARPAKGIYKDENRTLERCVVLAEES